MSKKTVAIVGGGITGLYLAYRLSPKYQVTVFEKEANLGGLMSAIETGPGWPIDSFYHHFFSSDKKLITLLEELSLPYFFTKPVTAIWQNNKVSPLSQSGPINQNPFRPSNSSAKNSPQLSIYPGQSKGQRFLS